MKLHVHFLNRGFGFSNVNLNVRIIIDEGGIEAYLEDGKEFEVIRATTIEEFLSELRRKLESLIGKCIIEDRIGGCIHKGWYIRVSIRRLLELFAFMLNHGIRDVNEGIVRYLESRGLSKSNYRVIIPTITALGLVRGGALSEEAEALGKAYMEGKQDEIAEILFKCALRNCILRNAIEVMADEGVEAALKVVGASRRDEMNYTAELLRIISRSTGFKCMAYQRAIIRYFEKGGCFVNYEPPTQCSLDLITTIFDYVKGEIESLLADIDVNIPVNALSPRKDRDVVYLSIGSKPIGVLTGSFIKASNASYVSKAREEVVRLEAIAGRHMRNSDLMFCIVLLPVIIESSCPRLRIYVMAKGKSGDWLGKFIER